MQVKMPHVLIARRFVMLTSRYAIAGIDLLHRQRYRSCEFMDRLGVANRQVVNVFVMIIRNDDDVAVIIRPLMRADKSCDQISAVNNIGLGRMDVIVLNTLNQETKWTDVILGSVMIQWRSRLSNF